MKNRNYLKKREIFNRVILIFSFSSLFLSATGQVDTIKPIFEGKVGILSYSNVNDTAPFVEYDQTENIGLQPAFYINGKFSSSTIIRAVDPMLIDSIHITKREIEIENKKHYGQIFIQMKNEYTPQIISLPDLASKYTNIKNGLTIYMLDNDIIKENYDECLVDETYILKIIVSTIEMDKENVNVIRLLTKSKENIEKIREIRIRGLDEIALN